jgi:hypothetical protein
MARYITELLKDANEDPSLLKTAAYKENFGIKTILEYAFNKNHKMNLPAGAPPYKPDAAPLGMSPSNFYQVSKKLYIFKRQDVPPVRLESVFIQTLESLHPSEAEVVVAIKDQTLESIYPNITTSVVVEAGYVPAAEAKEALVTADSKSGGKNLVLTIDDTAGARESFGAPAEAPVVAPAAKKRGRPSKKTAAQ